jgi:hypothetical protein
MRVRLLAFLAAIALAIPLAAQPSPPGVIGSFRFRPRPYPDRIATRAPYSAERVSEQVQIGADGTRFTTASEHQRIYRDSKGRTRTERPLLTGSEDPGVPVVIEITDPIAGLGYTFDSTHSVVHRYALSPPPAKPAAPQGLRILPVHPRPQTTTTREDLGIQTIEGAAARGSRTVVSWPTGSAGNDRPFKTVSEHWFSDELHETILSRTSDPRTGEQTTKLINISLAEPPAALFAPPAAFTVVDETGPFEIRWTAERHP